MADKTGIQWTDATWNPVAGCSIVSPGCTNCYAMGEAARLDRMQAMRTPDFPWRKYAGLTRPSKAGPVWNGEVRFWGQHIDQPLRWKRQRTIFVNSMSDLFHDGLSASVIDQVFAIMALAPQHRFQVLTKRSARMRAYLSQPGTPGNIAAACLRLWHAGKVDAHAMEKVGRWPVTGSWPQHDYNADLGLTSWPLPNVWLGVSTERQIEADQRIPDLLATPAAVRFISAEPLLGALDLCNIKPADRYEVNALTGYDFDQGQVFQRLDWVIVGGESGRHARPMHPDWARSLRDQCAAHGTPFFFKQWGEWLPGSQVCDLFSDERLATIKVQSVESDGIGAACFQVGKAKAGRLLDGIEHNAMPQTAEVAP